MTPLLLDFRPLLLTQVALEWVYRSTTPARLDLVSSVSVPELVGRLAVGIDVARLIDDGIDSAEVQRMLPSAHALDGALRELVHAQIHIHVLSWIVKNFKKGLYRLLLLLLLLLLHLCHAVLKLLLELLLPLSLPALEFGLQESLGLLAEVIFDLLGDLSEIEPVLSLEVGLVLLHLYLTG